MQRRNFWWGNTPDTVSEGNGNGTGTDTTGTTGTVHTDTLRQDTHTDTTGTHTDFNVDDFLSQTKNYFDTEDAESVMLDEMTGHTIWDTLTAIDPTHYIAALVEYGSEFMPWWASMFLVSFAIRASLIPVHISQQKNAARMSNHQKQISYYMERIKSAEKQGNEIVKRRALDERKEYFKANGISTWKSALTTVVQIPFFLFGMLAARKVLDAEKHPTLLEGGTLWFPNLLEIDPYFLPVLYIGGMILSTEVSMMSSGNTGIAGLRPEVTKWAIRSFMCLTYVFLCRWESGILIFWIGGMIAQLIIGLLAMTAFWKKKFNIPAMKIATKSMKQSNFQKWVHRNVPSLKWIFDDPQVEVFKKEALIQRIEENPDDYIHTNKGKRKKKKKSFIQQDEL